MKKLFLIFFILFTNYNAFSSNLYKTIMFQEDEDAKEEEKSEDKSNEKKESE